MPYEFPEEGPAGAGFGYGYGYGSPSARTIYLPDEAPWTYPPGAGGSGGGSGSTGGGGGGSPPRPPGPPGFLNRAGGGFGARPSMFNWNVDPNMPAPLPRRMAGATWGGGGGGGGRGMWQGGSVPVWGQGGGAAPANPWQGVGANEPSVRSASRSSATPGWEPSSSWGHGQQNAIPGAPGSGTWNRPGSRMPDVISRGGHGYSDAPGSPYYMDERGSISGIDTFFNLLQGGAEGTMYDPLGNYAPYLDALQGDTDRSTRALLQRQGLQSQLASGMDPSQSAFARMLGEASAFEGAQGALTGARQGLAQRNQDYLMDALNQILGIQEGHTMAYLQGDLNRRVAREGRPRGGGIGLPGIGNIGVSF